MVRVVLLLKYVALRVAELVFTEESQRRRGLELDSGRKTKGGPEKQRIQIFPKILGSRVRDIVKMYWEATTMSKDRGIS